MEQFLVLLTPLAAATAILSGAAFGLVIRLVRPAADSHLITFLALLLGALVYAPQAVQLGAAWLITGTGIQPWATLGRWCLFTAAFVPSMWIVLRWRKP